MLIELALWVLLGECLFTAGLIITLMVYEWRQRRYGRRFMEKFLKDAKKKNISIALYRTRESEE